MTPPPALPILYSFRRCPYAMRARLALMYSGQRCELREVVLRSKPAALLQASPKGTVPVLVLPDGRVLEQSLDIMLWALQRHDPGAWLEPSHGTLEDMLALIATCDGPFKHALDRCKYPNRYPDSDLAPAREQAAQCLADWNRRLEQHPFLMGRHASLADMALAPFVRQFAGIAPANEALQPWPRLQQWLADWQAGDLLARIMDKVEAWSEGDGEVVFFGAPGVTSAAL